jgi:hypothetical protein
MPPFPPSFVRWFASTATTNNTSLLFIKSNRTIWNIKLDSDQDNNWQKFFEKYIVNPAIYVTITSWGNYFLLKCECLIAAFKNELLLLQTCCGSSFLVN